MKVGRLEQYLVNVYNAGIKAGYHTSVLLLGQPGYF